MYILCTYCLLYKVLCTYDFTRKWFFSFQNRQYRIPPDQIYCRLAQNRRTSNSIYRLLRHRPLPGMSGQLWWRHASFPLLLPPDESLVHRLVETPKRSSETFVSIPSFKSHAVYRASTSSSIMASKTSASPPPFWIRRYGRPWCSINLVNRHWIKLISYGEE